MQLTISTVTGGGTFQIRFSAADFSPASRHNATDGGYTLDVSAGQKLAEWLNIAVTQNGPLFEDGAQIKPGVAQTMSKTGRIRGNGFYCFALTWSGTTGLVAGAFIVPVQPTP
jgi:hypothetical protein